MSNIVRKSPNLLRQGDWNKELEGGLPDSRLRDPSRNIVYRGRIPYEIVYCANCGKPEGLVTAEWAPHCFALCKECGDTFGKLNFVEIPKDVAEGKKPFI